LKIYFAPGERFNYSGEGFVYLQRAVERITRVKIKRSRGKAREVIVSPFFSSTLYTEESLIFTSSAKPARPARPNHKASDVRHQRTFEMTARLRGYSSARLQRAGSV
jgi:hypothetical protein